MSQHPSTARILWNIAFIVVAIPLVTFAILAFRSQDPRPAAKIRGSRMVIVRIPYEPRGYDESRGYDDVLFGQTSGYVWRESSGKQHSPGVAVSADLVQEMTTIIAGWCAKAPTLPMPRPDRMYYVTLSCPGRFHDQVIAFNIGSDSLPAALKAIIAMAPSLEP